MDFEEKYAHYLNEAFASGKASMVVQKLGSILTKKIGTMVQFSTVDIGYENSYGTFKGFLGTIGSGNSLIRINFLIDKSDAIYSMDVYVGGYNNVPTYTVDLENLNIVQIVNTIAENLMEDSIIDLQEKAGRPSARNPKELTYIIEKFVEEVSSAKKDLQNKSLSEVYSSSYKQWAKDKPNYSTDELKYHYWVKIVKFYLAENGLTNKTFRKRKDGTRERQVEDPILQAQLEDIADSITWKEKYDFLFGAIEQMDQGRIQSIYLWGNPGSGKSFETKKKLDELGSAYTIYSGGLKGPAELIRMLWTHRMDEILVLDDFDDVTKNKSQVNILKAALQNDPVREITWVQDSKSAKSAEIPAKFKFSTGVIFISNQGKLDKALASRSIVINIDMSNTEILEKIDETLKDYRPEVPMSDKKEIFEYMQEIAPGVKSIDYRIMDSLLVAKQITSNWKKMGLAMLSGTL